MSSDEITVGGMRLRAAGDEVMLTLGFWVQGVQSCRDAYAALAAWQEARRGDR